MTWKKVVAWSAVALVTLVVVMTGALFFLLRSSSFHRYIVAKVEQKASESLNTPAQFRDFAVHLSPLSADLYDVVIRGTGAATQPPLLTADHIKVGVTIISVLRLAWNLNDIEIDHPVAHLLVNAQGETNLPPPSSTSSQQNVFDLAIQHARVQRGELYYNDRKSVIEAEVHDLAFRSAYDNAHDGRYYGAFGYRDGQLLYDGFAPMTHDLRANFDATRAGVTLNPVVLRIAGSEAQLQATLRNYSNPVIDAKCDATLVTGEFRRILHNPAVPIGVVHFNGSAHYENAPNRPAMDAVSAEGELSSRALLVEVAAGRAEVNGLTARLQLRNGNLNIPEMRARLLGGEFDGKGSVQEVAGAQRGELTASLRALNLANLQTMEQQPALQQVKLGGVIDANAKASWQGSVRNLVATVDGTIKASVAQRAPATGAAPQPVPLNGIVHARYVGRTQEITLTQSSIRTAQTTLTLNGTVATRSSLQVALQSNDLHELEAMADVFRKPPPGQALGLRGTASFTGNIRGSAKEPQLTGHLVARDVRVKGSDFRLLRTDVSASPNGVSLENGDLEPAVQGKLTFAVNVGLRDWSYNQRSPIAVSANASQLSVVDLAHAAGLQSPITGVLNAEIAVKGSQENPTGNGTVSLVKASVYGEPIQALNLQFEGTGEVLHATLDLRSTPGAAQAKLTYFPKQEKYEAEVQAPGFSLDQLRTPRAHNLHLAGQLSVTANGSGTFKNPELQATVRIPQLELQGQTISEVNLQASVANHEGRFTLSSQAANTSIHAHGNVNLTGEYFAEATLDTQGIPLQPIFAIYLPAQAPEMSGQTELHATLRGPLKNRQQLEAHLTIPVLRAQYQTFQIAATTPIRADYVNGVVAIQAAEFKGTATELHLQGNVPVADTAPVSLNLTGNLDLGLLKILQPDIESSGQLQFDIHMQGERSNPNVQGEVRIADANLLPTGAPVGVQHGNGVLTLHNQRLDITRFQGSLGAGTVTASGGIAYAQGLKFDLAAAANGVQFIYQGVRVSLDSKLAFTGTTQAARLSGQVRVASIGATPDFDVTNLLSSAGGPSISSPGTGFVQNIKLNIGVQSSSQLNLVSRSLSAQGDLNLRIAGTADDPVILGRVNLNGGDLLFLGNRYVIRNGELNFVNPITTEPYVNVTATTTISEYNITLRVEGPAERLRTTYTSDPSLPPIDIINLLARGTTTEAANANPTPGNLQAESLLASQLSSQLTNRVEKIAGISHLSVDPALGGGGTQQNPGARITIQQRVTSNLFVTFSTDVTSTQNQVIQLEYHLSRRWSFSSVRDQNGGFGFDARVHQDF